MVTSKKAGQPRKAISHERILAVATRAIRQGGYAGTSVADIMQEAGLTHGGFYAHFDSRDAMLAEATDHAGAESVAALEKLASSAPSKAALRTLLRAYLSRAHLEHAATGCPVAAVGSEMRRQAPQVRHAATRRIKDMIALVGRLSPDRHQAGSQDHALTTTATMVGALILARAVDDPRLADQLLDAAFRRLSGD